MLEIRNLHVSVEGEEVLKGFTIMVKPGEIHAIMGPNGAGKSTLAKVLAGHPSYEITEGTMTLHGVELTELEPEERVHIGLFMGFQYPIEINGCSNREFLFSMHSAKRKAQKLPPLSQEEFSLLLKEKLRLMHMKEEFLERDVNVGFSGGEKKRNEILQMAVLEPTVAILDETDSGLDIDAMKVVAEGINQQKTPEKAVILITHYQRLLDYVKPDYVHVVIEGAIVKTGDASLALTLEKQGYDWLSSHKIGV